MKRFLIVVTACFCFFIAGLAPSNSSASIIASYSGSSWTTEEQGVVAAAVSAWSSLLDITHDLTITFSLADLYGSTLGSTSITGDSSGLPTAASITIDTGSWISWNLSSIASGDYDSLTLIYPLFFTSEPSRQTLREIITLMVTKSTTAATTALPILT